MRVTILDLDECSSAPCVNGGSCEDEINGYLCKCSAGYFGINCQTGTTFNLVFFSVARSRIFFSRVRYLKRV